MGVTVDKRSTKQIYFPLLDPLKALKTYNIYNKYRVVVPIRKIVAIFRCKLFYKKEQSYSEKGVGTLHLKPTDDGRVQLIIRAGTALGIVR